MASFFALLNSYEDHIISSITIVLGGLQTAASSWAIHRLILDEHFLMFFMGDMMRASSSKKDVHEKYSTAMVLLDSKAGVLMILKMIKIAFSVALVSGVFQILSSLFLLFMKSKHNKTARYLWTFCNVISAFFLAASFVILWLYWVKNIDYFQISLTCTGVNFFVLAHLVATMAPAVILEIFYRFRKPAEEETLKKDDSSGSSKTGFSTASTSTTSLNTDVKSDKVEMKPQLVSSENETKRHSRSQSRLITALDISLPLPPPPPSPTVK